MRKILLGAVVAILAMAVPATASAGTTTYRQKTAYAFASERWDNGSYGGMRLVIRGRDMEFEYNSTMYDDVGQLLWVGGHSTFDGNIDRMVDAEFHQRRLEAAHLSFTETGECIWVDPFQAGADEEGCIQGTQDVSVQWTGVGPITRTRTVSADGSVSIEATRAATLVGWFDFNGMVLPGADFSLGTGELVREREIG